MRPLPEVGTLQAAVRAVIESNKADGYNPTRFTAITANGHTPDLLTVCENLIVKGETLEYLDKALPKFPTLLTLEDFVERFGGAWGFSDMALREARARVEWFDQLAQGHRYA